MDFSIKFDTPKSGWSNVHIEGEQLLFPKKCEFLSLKKNYFPAIRSRYISKSTHLRALSQQRIKEP